MGIAASYIQAQLEQVGGSVFLMIGNYVRTNVLLLTEHSAHMCVFHCFRMDGTKI